MSETAASASPTPPAPVAAGGGGGRVHTGPDGSPVGGPATVIEERSEQMYTPCFFRFITAITRIWTILTIIALWIVTVHLINHKDNFTYTPWYMLVVSIFMTLFEMIWVLDKCVSKFRDEGCLCCCRVWRAFVWVDNWKKSLVYIMLGIPCFLDGVIAWEAILCGLCIFIVAFLYFMKSFQESKCILRKKYTSKYTRITNMEAGTAGSNYGAISDEHPQITSTQEASPQPPARPASPPARPAAPPSHSQPASKTTSTNPFDDSSESTGEQEK